MWRGAHCALVLIVGMAAPSLAESSQRIMIKGELDCGQWVAARNSDQSKVYGGFVIGMLNGLALGRATEFWTINGATISTDAVYLWMDNYCQTNPLSMVATGVVSLYDQRSGWSPPAPTRSGKTTTRQKTN